MGNDVDTAVDTVYIHRSKQSLFYPPRIPYDLGACMIYRSESKVVQLPGSRMFRNLAG